PPPGNRHFFRSVDMPFGVRFLSEATPDLDRVPRTALPPRALVILFSPLLDRRALSAVTDLRQRGVSLVIVDGRPPRAVVFFSPPLPDRRARSGVTDLRQRGVSLVIVDVLPRDPPAEPRQ